MKRLKILGLLVCVSVAAAPAISQYGRNRDRPGATFYVKDDYQGRSVFVDRPVRSFREFDMNDKTSSIAIQGGRWLVCEDDDFRGHCEVVDRSIKRLDRIGMDDRISSARPLDGDDNGGRPGNGNWGGNQGGYQGGGRPGGPYGALPGGSWAQSCRGGQMDGGTLRAECNDGSRWRVTQINPRQCPAGRLGNDRGTLVCE